ncbi:MAG: sodium:proton antiporter [Muribaculaceae bacterium]|nr:sodium:proton antiporter [Muribaculaceae bacterium]
MKFTLRRAAVQPPLLLSALPIISLLGFFTCVVLTLGADAISDYSCVALLSASAVALVLAMACGSLNLRGLRSGFRRSAAQILPAVPMLVCIAMVATTWMLSGVVPTLVDYGVSLLSPRLFLFVTCVVCGLISVLTGSSWSTIATIGVAFMGIGTVMGFSPAWIAGAIISGAYFGDKVSPLSDTTVVASSACGVDLFKHIKYLMLTAIPSMLLALGVFLVAGFNIEPSSAVAKADIVERLGEVFELTPLTLVIPAVTIALIVLRVPTLLVLLSSGLLGLAGIYIFQPGIVDMLGADGPMTMALRLLWGATTFDTGNAAFDDLVSTSGIIGMLPTIALVLCAMVFGTVMIGTGMLSRLTHAITAKLHSRFGLVGSTVGSGLFINACTADQYLSLIIGGNMYRNAYRRFGLEPRLLSRTLEDSVSVTSVLIPWNSCGVTQSAVLGVATVAYLPYCVFNYLSPLMSLLMAFTGYRIKQTVTAAVSPRRAATA